MQFSQDDPVEVVQHSGGSVDEKQANASVGHGDTGGPREMDVFAWP